MLIGSNHILRQIFIFCLLVLSPHIYAAESKIDQIVIFGDSLSDNGNLFRRTLNIMPPSYNYYYGRFTNNYGTWADYMANFFNQQGYLSHHSNRSNLFGNIVDWKNDTRKGFILNYAVGGSTAVNYYDKIFPSHQSDLKSKQIKKCIKESPDIAYSLVFSKGNKELGDVSKLKDCLNSAHIIDNNSNIDPNLDPMSQIQYLIYAFLTASLDEQFDTYIAENPDKNKKNTLAIIFSGANDYMSMGLFEQGISIPNLKVNYNEIADNSIENVKKLIKDLNDKGIHNIALIGLPDITKTPSYQMPELYYKAYYNKYCTQQDGCSEAKSEIEKNFSTSIRYYNNKLNDLAESSTDNLLYFDIAKTFDSLFDVNNSPIPELNDTIHACVASSFSIADPDQIFTGKEDEFHSYSSLFKYRKCLTNYVFWDSVHPNSKVHKLIFEKLISRLTDQFNLPNKDNPHVGKCSAIYFDHSLLNDLNDGISGTSHIQGTDCSGNKFDLETRDLSNGLFDRSILYVKNGSLFTHTLFGSLNKPSFQYTLSDSSENYMVSAIDQRYDGYTWKALQPKKINDSVEPVDFNSFLPNGDLKK